MTAHVSNEPANTKPERPLDAPGYSEAHEEVDYHLYHAKGLIFALDQVVTSHPHLSGTEPETDAVYALLKAIEQQVKSAISLQAKAWETLGGQALGGENPA